MMKPGKPLLVCLLLSVLNAHAEGPLSETKQAGLQPETAIAIERVGKNRLKIGNIVVDKETRSFEVNGRFLRDEPPFEFIAVAKGGDRGYESLLELEADVYQFNLACILIGLDNNRGIAPKFHFDPTPVDGDSVEIWLYWNLDGKGYQVEAANLVQYQNRSLNQGEWVYTGSSFAPKEYGGGYLPAENGGTLIGFVHDPASIIEHRTGFGAGSFSEIVVSNNHPFTVDTPVVLRVKYLGNKSE